MWKIKLNKKISERKEKLFQIKELRDVWEKAWKKKIDKSWKHKNCDTCKSESPSWVMPLKSCLFSTSLLSTMKIMCAHCRTLTKFIDEQDGP